MIDPARATGAELETVTTTWTEDDVILYHLALGAGVPPTHPGELRYTYERELKVLPSFAAVSALVVLPKLEAALGAELDYSRTLHGAQEVVVDGPLPVRATVEHRGRVAAVFDKGHAALLVLEVSTVDCSGTVLAVSRYSIFARGAGGFGGDRGPSEDTSAPQRASDTQSITVTLPQQALLYRLTGDKNALHVDPEFARESGFERPVLHGLCTFGVACKAVIDTVLDGDVDLVSSYRARFAGPVFPGDRLTTRIWRETEHIALETIAVDRDMAVLVGGRLSLRT